MSVLIKCPHCGAEYLVEEIFMGEDVIGTRMPIKDEDGKILHIDGDEPTYSAEYICDKCDTKFIAKLNISVDSVTEIKDTWDEEYTVEIHKNRVELAE